MTTDKPTAVDIETVDGRRISRIWLVPLAALVVAGLVLWKSWAEQGPLVTIYFTQGHGITAGKTEVRYADVRVGLVETVALSEDLASVIVEARLEPFMQPFLGDTTQFWIVKARLSGGSVSGLGTLLSGAYIEAGWEQSPSTAQREFVGFDSRPQTPPGTPGRHFSLSSPSASSVSVGSPILYRDLRVGQIEAISMSEDFSAVNYRAFVEAPYDSLLNATTRFWNQSGVDIDVGFDGLLIHFDSLESLIAGGISFGNIGRTIGTSSRDDGNPYRIYRNRNAALEASFEIVEGNGYLLMTEFDESVRGLEPGAPIEWQGIVVGRVREVVVNLEVDDQGSRQIYAVLEMQPERVGIEGLSSDALQAGMNDWIQSGMRAQLAAGNLLSGRKLIRLVDNAAPPDASLRIDFSAQPYPRLPTIPAADVGAISANVERIVANVAALPLDQLIDSVVTLVDAAETVVGNPAMADMPAQVRATLRELELAAGNINQASEKLPDLVASVLELTTMAELALAGLSPDSELYVEVSNAVVELRDATRSLAELLETLDDKPNALLMGR